MNKNIATTLGILFLAAIVALAGCSGGSSNDNKPANEPNNSASNGSASNENAGSSDGGEDDGFQLGRDPLTFSFYANYDWWVLEPWGEDPGSKWIQDNLKVTMEMIQSGGAAQQKLSTMIVSNDLPDAMILDRGANVEKLRQAGLLVPFDDWIDKYPNMKKWVGEATINMLRSPDGKLYQFPNWYTNQPNGNSGYLINRKIYKELGSPKLETFDDLYNYLKLVKERYPDVVPLEVGMNGDGVEIMSSGFQELYSPQYVRMRAVPVDGKLTSIFKDPVYRETVKFASRLFREKLMTQDTFTQKTEQIAEKMRTGRVAVAVVGAISNSEYAESNAILREQDPEAGYDVIWPLRKEGLDKNKIMPNSYNSLGWNVVVITKNAENPEGIFAYLDWLTGEEGQRIAVWGPPGRYWDEIDEDGAPIFNERYATTPQTEKNKDRLGAFNFVGNTAFVDTTKAKEEMKLPEEQRNWTTMAQVNVTWRTSQDLTEFVNLDPPPDSPEGIAQQAVQDLYQQYFAEALYAKSDEEVDAILDKAHEAAMSVGFGELLEFETQKWQENRKKMGLD